MLFLFNKKKFSVMLRQLCLRVYIYKKDSKSHGLDLYNVQNKLS